MKATAKIRQITISVMILGLVLALPSVSMAAEVESIDILDYGLYKTGFNKWQAAPKTTRGRIEIVAAKELVEMTDTIPTAAGTEFGIRYVVNGQKEGKHVKLLVKVLHSDMDSSNQWVIARKIGSASFDGWKFDSDLELAPGKLTIQLFHQGAKLAEKKFTIY